MRVAELRELLETLPERFDDTEVMVYDSRGLVHISTVELDRRKANRDPHNELWNDVPDDRLERKLRIRGSRCLWMEQAPLWQLKGWWPKEAAEIGLGAPE